MNLFYFFFCVTLSVSINTVPGTGLMSKNRSQSSLKKQRHRLPWSPELTKGCRKVFSSVFFLLRPFSYGRTHVHPECKRWSCRRDYRTEWVGEFTTVSSTVQCLEYYFETGDTRTSFDWRVSGRKKNSEVLNILRHLIYSPTSERVVQQ